jgi:hypothetical protein
MTLFSLISGTFFFTPPKMAGRVLSAIELWNSFLNHKLKKIMFQTFKFTL